jgi:hypothetical protein
MKLILIILFIGSSAWGGMDFSSGIHSIIEAEGEGKPHFVKLNDGRVLWPDQAGLELARQWRPQHHTASWSKDLQLVPHIPVGSFNPTVILGQAAARRLFSNLNRDYKQDSITQCYNRAHIWAYEEFRKSGLHSQKTFVFFSDDYIRKNNFEWWFHVAPTILVDEQGELKHQVLDHQFADGPLDLRDWTGLWVKDRHCPFINKYSQYYRAMRNEDCYMMNVPMFFWQPRDLEDFEKTLIPKTQFIQWEIQHAYQEAFGR